MDPGSVSALTGQMITADSGPNIIGHRQQQLQIMGLLSI